VISPNAIGLGLRTVHYAHILEQRPKIGFFEILSENFLRTAGRPMHILDLIAELYPIVMHGVSLSIGGTDPLDLAYLRELRDLKERTGATIVSDHLCWTGVAGKNTHDLLPMPLTEEALTHVVDRVHAVQDLLGGPLALENPSSYAQFACAQMSEWEFLGRVAERTGGGILLDVNNVFVSSKNHGFDPLSYLRGLPLERVVQFHVAGHTDFGTHLLDTHIGPVPDAVWELLGKAHQLGARAPVLLEWDADIPPFEEVHADAMRAQSFTAHDEAVAS
jgi:uncharacterized protein (UPF0276 family)